MIIYLDSDYKCHLVNDGSMLAYETEFFDNKCETFIKGYRLVPFGHEWIDQNGIVFKGEMMSPWQNHTKLQLAQADYERELIFEYESALTEIENTLNNE